MRALARSVRGALETVPSRWTALAVFLMVLAWFTALGDAANRRREPWVLEGLRYLHHPLRAAASEKYLETSLLLLKDIQRTGDIFFPKRWMDVTLGGYQSPAAAAAVRRFLDRVPPDYPERLRRIILSSADDLFRASAQH